MNIGLIGMPNSGKTTIFNALTKSEAQVTSYANSKSEPNRAVVKVIDNRVEALSEMSAATSCARTEERYRSLDNEQPPS